MRPWSRRTFTLGLTAVGALAPAHARAGAKRLDRIRRRAMPEIEDLFATRGVDYPPAQTFVRAFKHERELELWAASHRDDALTLIETHTFCAASGGLGPKRRQGDLQVPEGAYVFDRYNPWSSYHLSMRVSYPNRSDRVRGVRWNLGGEIRIHGSCASIGCIAIEDRPIERVFIPVYEGSRKGRTKPPVHIFPARFDAERTRKVLDDAADGDEQRLGFWDELEPIHAAFEDTHRPPIVQIERKTGRYVLGE